MTGKPRVLIISPATANANNGNWQTASRWAGFLQDRYDVRLLQDWQGQDAELMIALHARRSAPSISAWRKCHPQAPLVLVLTGTDLYRDIRHDESAQRSLRQASRLVVLQEAAQAELTAPDLPPVQIIFQSAPAPQPTPHKPQAGDFRLIMIGHLRPEKMPDTYMQAASILPAQDLQMLHVGAALDAELGALAQQTAATCPHYRWLGALPHEEVLTLLAQCDLMVISSAMEGGANVIAEAVVAGVPVLASDIAGNRGMLGADYAGYFPLGDAKALAALVARAQGDPAFLAALQAQCRARATLFDPAREQTLVRELVDNVCRPQQDQATWTPPKTTSG